MPVDSLNCFMCYNCMLQDTTVRFACKQAMIRVLKPKSKTSKSKPAGEDDMVQEKDVSKEVKPVQASDHSPNIPPPQPPQPQPPQPVSLYQN